MKMKKILVGLVAVCVACAVARGESPARVVGTVATGGTSFAVPASGGMAFRLEAVLPLGALRWLEEFQR